MDAPSAIPEITPADLARQLEAGADLQVLDVRAPHRLASGRVDLGPGARFINLAGSELRALPDPSSAGIDRALPVAVVCGRGKDSRVLTAHLLEHGYQAQSVIGGMAAWMQLLVPRELPAPGGFDRLVQFDRVGKGALCYLLISGSEALAIDVPRSTQAIEDAAATAGARIVAVAETHAHADYLSGGADLAARTGATYYLHPSDSFSPYDGTPGQLEFSPLHDGQVLAIGHGQIAVRHTPGHTEGSVTFVAGAASDTAAAFTGDFIFVQSIGRPDLAGKLREWALMLYTSLSIAKENWPDGLRIYPAHYAGHAERNRDKSIGRTFGEIRAANAPLSISDPIQFIAWIEGHVSTPPPAYRRIKTVNLGLDSVDGMEADELETGKNECAVG